jgi:hypothetical protein
MKKKLDRATDGHLVLAALKQGKPKPTKENKPKRVPVAKRRKILEKQCADMVKMIIAWRDGQVCVMGQMDGARCGNGLMWNHYIAQGTSPWMRLNLGNVYWGCGSHNLLDKYGDPILGIFVQDTFGTAAVKALREEAKLHTGIKHTEAELETILATLDELYQNRYTADLTLGGLVLGGYYGATIKAVFE